MVGFIRLVYCLRVFYILSVLGFVRESFGWGNDDQLPPLEHHMCPSENTETLECYRMTTHNATCAVTKIEGCIPFLHGFCQWHFTVEHVPCTVYKCEHAGCCDGWVEDEKGKCIQDSNLGSIQCYNDGFMSEDGDTCSCPDMFTGHLCETPICDEACLNGGRCDVINNTRQCVCPSKFFTGSTCEQVTCKEPCENGGECIADGMLSRCKCSSGYLGDRCQYEMNYDCPFVTTNENIDACKHVMNECDINNRCPANQICCYNGCAGQCLNPANNTCRYRGKHYQTGESFTPEPCKKCVCQPWGDFQCTKVVCPPTECEDGHSPISVEGHCCKVCPGADLSSEDEGPEFENCPNSFVTINVREDGKTARIIPSDLDLRVASGDGTPLGVSYSRTRFNHSKSRDIKQNMHIVTAYSDCDASGRRAECTLMVIVRDPYPPTFTSCPMEIFALNNENITWTDPTAKDNVGIAKVEASGDEIRNSVLTVGMYTVSYTVWDYDQNQAICAFAVHVFDKDTDPLHYPKEIKKRKPERNFSVAAILGSVFVLTLLVIVVIYLAVCVIKTRSLERNGTQSSPEDHIYAVCGHGNHAYQNFGKLPAYTPPTNPPPYEEIDHSFENPPIYEEISNSRTAEEEHSYANIVSGLSNPAYENETAVLKYMKV